jgi:hypothetical protein
MGGQMRKFDNRKNVGRCWIGFTTPPSRNRERKSQPLSRFYKRRHVAQHHETTRRTLVQRSLEYDLWPDASWVTHRHAKKRSHSILRKSENAKESET